MDRPSPGLQMHHGFLRKIEQNQHSRERQVKEDAERRRETSKLARRVGMRPAAKDSKPKPEREIYIPPSLRTADNFNVATRPSENGENHWSPEPQFQSHNNHHHHDHQRAALETGQYVLVTNNHREQPMIMHDLSKSRSMTAAHRVRFQEKAERFSPPRAPPRSEIHVVSYGTSTNVSKAPHQPSSGYELKRSKSLGTANVNSSFSSELDFSVLGAEMQSIIFKAIENPNFLHARQMMEIVRHLFSCVLESERFAKEIASICVIIIEREKTETFIETLLNSCREWFFERSRVFNEDSFAINSNRMVAYVTFLNELYTRLQGRKQSSPSLGTAATWFGGGANSPAAIILTLLSECCHLLMKPSSLFCNSEIECLFVVLTKIGRDLQNEHPQRMQQLMSAARDAFVAPTTPRSARKILLQLIEMSASNWQLASSAVAYYYPNRQ